VAAGEEDDGECGDQEIVEANLLCTVDVRGLVEVCEDLDSIFREFDDLACIARVLLD